jgi:glycosyltransferase involved in cell wall biosynthesis
VRLAFVVERPTQFEAPFYRFAARDAAHSFEVWFTAATPAAPVFDPELGRSVSWGFDLLQGYPHERLPRGARLAEKLRGLDLLIVNGYTQAPYLRAIAAARRAGIRTALRIDSVLFDAQAAPLTKRLLFSGVLLRLFDVFLATGSLTRAYLEACGVPSARIGLFPYAVDVEHFRERARLSPEARSTRREALAIPRDAPVGLCVCKLNAREAPWDVLRASALRPDAEPYWLIAGDGPEREALERFARKRGLGRVRFLGYVEYSELPALYGTSDLFVHAVRAERWGVSVAEALAAGLPVVTSSRVGAARDLVVAGRNGFAYAFGDPQALGERVRDALGLTREGVRLVNESVLSRWDYASCWLGLLASAGFGEAAG